MRSALATAKRDGLIRHNPADSLALPRRESVQEDEHETVKALSRDQLASLLDASPERYRLLFQLMASTGLRVSEAVALQRKHVVLDRGHPRVRVRRAIVRRRVEPPKSRHGRREVALPQSLTCTLRKHLAELDDQSTDALVFPSRNATPLDADNLRARVVKPLMKAVGAPWAAWHTLRHTYASIQLAAGVNVVQLSRALGHHSASFTLDTYVHMLPGEEALPLDLTDTLADESGQRLGNRPHVGETHEGDAVLREVA